MTGIVKLVDRSGEFVAEQVEAVGSGWLYAVGRWRWQRHDLDERGEVRAFYSYSPESSFLWPARKIEEVKHVRRR